MRGCKRAYSLSELLIGMTICSLLMTVILIFCVNGVKLWRLGAAKVDINEQALMAVHAFRTYCGASHVLSAYINPAGVDSGISFLSGDKGGVIQYTVSAPGPGCFNCGCGPPPPPPCGCACAPPPVCPPPIPPQLPYAQDGFIIWQKFQVLYYTKATREIRLGELAINPPSMSPVPYRLTAYAPKPTDRLIASNIDIMTVSESPLDKPCPPACPCPFPCPPSCPCTPINPQIPQQNPLFVQITASEGPNHLSYDGDNNYTTTINSAVTFNNGFAKGVNSGEAACCVGSCCACFP